MSLLAVCGGALVALATEPIVLFDTTGRSFDSTGTEGLQTAGLRLPSPSPWYGDEEEDAGVASQVTSYNDCALLAESLRKSWMAGDTFGVEFGFGMNTLEYFVILLYTDFVRQVEDLSLSLASSEGLLMERVWRELLQDCQYAPKKRLPIHTTWGTLPLDAAPMQTVRVCMQTLRTLRRRVVRASDRVVAMMLLIRLLDGPLPSPDANDAALNPDLEVLTNRSGEQKVKNLIRPRESLPSPDENDTPFDPDLEETRTWLEQYHEVVATAPVRGDLDEPRPHELLKKWIRAVERCATEWRSALRIEEMDMPKRRALISQMPSRVSLSMALRMADGDDLVVVARDGDDDVQTCIWAAVAAYPRGEDVASPNGTHMMHTTGLLQHLESPSLHPPEDCLGGATENERDLAYRIALLIDKESRECVNQRKLLAATLDVLRYRVTDEWPFTEDACTVRGLMHRVQKSTRDTAAIHPELSGEARCRVEAHVAQVISKTALRHVPRVDRRSYGVVRCSAILVASAARLLPLLLGSICLLCMAVAVNRMSSGPQEGTSAKPKMRKLTFRHKRVALLSPTTV